MSRGDKQLLNVSAEEQETLMRLLGKDIVVTPTAMGNALAWLLGRLRNADESSNTACVQSEWGSVSDAARVLSMTKQGATPYFSRWIAEGKLRVKEVESIEGKKSRRLYNLYDVSQCVNNSKCPDDVFINS